MHQYFKCTSRTKYTLYTLQLQNLMHIEMYRVSSQARPPCRTKFHLSSEELSSFFSNYTTKQLSVATYIHQLRPLTCFLMPNICQDIPVYCKDIVITGRNIFPRVSSLSYRYYCSRRSCRTKCDLTC